MLKCSYLYELNSNPSIAFTWLNVFTFKCEAASMNIICSQWIKVKWSLEKATHFNLICIWSNRPCPKAPISPFQRRGTMWWAQMKISMPWSFYQLNATFSHIYMIQSRQGNKNSFPSISYILHLYSDVHLYKHISMHTTYHFLLFGLGFFLFHQEMEI